MENIESVKGPSVLDRAMDEVTAIKATISDSLHSVKLETEAKVEHLKEDILHKGPQLLGKAKEEIQHLVDAAIHPKFQGEVEGEVSTPVETSIPILGENLVAFAKEEISTIAANTISIVKENEGSFLSFFANIFVKCCEPFNQKKD